MAMSLRSDMHILEVVLSYRLRAHAFLQSSLNTARLKRPLLFNTNTAALLPSTVEQACVILLGLF